MARKSRKNVQATPAVVVDPVQYKVALYARISVENEQKREADTICIAEIYQPRCAQLFVPAICVVNTGEETASMATKSILITKRD